VYPGFEGINWYIQRLMRDLPDRWGLYLYTIH
jgi:hypothetical protein